MRISSTTQNGFLACQAFSEIVEYTAADITCCAAPMIGVSVKAGFCTVDWTVDSTMDWIATHSMQPYSIQWKHPVLLCLLRCHPQGV